MDDKALEIIEITKSENVQFIDLQFTDIFGSHQKCDHPDQRTGRSIGARYLV